MKACGVVTTHMDLEWTGHLGSISYRLHSNVPLRTCSDLEVSRVPFAPSLDLLSVLGPARRILMAVLCERAMLHDF
jgi:hypothetical protein